MKIQTPSRPKARGSVKPRSVMNKLEADYASYLELQVFNKNVHDYEYEAVTLRLAKGSRYTPDFMVIKADGLVEFHETKGFWREAARVRIKVAADRFPWFRFVAIQRGKKGGPQWVTEEFGP